MKVLHLVTVEGASFFEQQIEALEERGIECTVIAATAQGRDRFKESRIPYPKAIKRNYGHNLAYYVIASSMFLPKIVHSLIKNRDFDVIHANSGLVAPFALIQPIRPVVLSLWGSDMDGDYLGGWYSHATRHFAKHTDANIVMNERMCQELGATAKVIPHGVDLEIFKPISQTTAQNEVGWDTEKNHVVFLSDPSKDVKNYPLAEKVVKEAERVLQEEICLHPVHDQPHDKVPKYLNASDLLLLTSKHEGSPNAVKEARACNVPVVSTDVGDCEEQLSGVSLSYVCSGESELVDSVVNILREGSRSDGRESVSQDLDSMTKQLIKLYEDVLDDYHEVDS